MKLNPLRHAIHKADLKLTDAKRKLVRFEADIDEAHHFLKDVLDLIHHMETEEDADIEGYYGSR